MKKLVFCTDAPLVVNKITAGGAGFTLLETLVAMVVFSVAIMGLSTVSLSLVNTNKLTRHNFDASVLAQSHLEILRNTGFGLGADGVLGTSDDVIPPNLTSVNPSNSTLTDPAKMFTQADHAYTLTNGAETTPILDSPGLTTPTAVMRRTWIVRDIPSLGIKSVTVVVGWREGSTNFYSVASTAIQGQ
ncbi:MAG: prepilin-type N-terminal cleavage/methylation domain-containing protein [Nitrospinae bacterium]|nr:prepilin-type N-terminal cleavage/methylation domain-containing protein [Nitrospinota bacterium]